jgi:hypothetical protein
MAQCAHSQHLWSHHLVTKLNFYLSEAGLWSRLGTKCTWLVRNWTLNKNEAGNTTHARQCGQGQYLCLQHEITKLNFESRIMLDWSPCLAQCAQALILFPLHELCSYFAIDPAIEFWPHTQFRNKERLCRRALTSTDVEGLLACSLPSLCKFVFCPISMLPSPSPRACSTPISFLSTTLASAAPFAIPSAPLAPAPPPSHSPPRSSHQPLPYQPATKETRVWWNLSADPPALERLDHDSSSGRWKFYKPYQWGHSSHTPPSGCHHTENLTPSTSHSSILGSYLKNWATAQRAICRILSTVRVISKNPRSPPVSAGIPTESALTSLEIWLAHTVLDF